MRLSHVDLLATATERMKVLIPTLTGASGSVQAELFIVYSTLKYITRELQQMAGCEQEKRLIAKSLRERLVHLVATYQGERWADRLAAVLPGAFHDLRGAEALTDHLVAVTAILGEVDGGEWPADKAELVYGWIASYLHECNQAELRMFREA